MLPHNENLKKILGFFQCCALKSFNAVRVHLIFKNAFFSPSRRLQYAGSEPRRRFGALELLNPGLLVASDLAQQGLLPNVSFFHKCFWAPSEKDRASGGQRGGVGAAAAAAGRIKIEPYLYY